MSESARADSVAQGSVCLRGIFHHPYTDTLGLRQQPLDLSGLTIQMHGDNGAGPLGHGCLDGGSVDQVRLIISTVDKNWSSPGACDGLGSCNERVGRQDYLVARLDAERAEDDFDGVSPVRHGNALSCSNIRGVLSLEGGDLGAADECGPGQDFLPALSHFFCNGSMLRAQVDKRN
jgi:hypothetical protein